MKRATGPRLSLYQPSKWLWLITCIVTSSLLPTPSDARFHCISNLLYTLDGETTCNQDANGLVVAAGQPGFYCDRIANLNLVRESLPFPCMLHQHNASKPNRNVITIKSAE